MSFVSELNDRSNPTHSIILSPSMPQSLSWARRRNKLSEGSKDKSGDPSVALLLQDDVMRQIPRFGMSARGIASHSARNDKRMRELLRGGYTEKGAGQECPAYRVRRRCRSPKNSSGGMSRLSWLLE